MPVLIGIVVISFLTGLLVGRPGVVYAVTGALALLANVVFVVAIADGKGDDPGWLLALSIAAAAVAFGAAWLAMAARRRFGHSRGAAATS